MLSKVTIKRPVRFKEYFLVLAMHYFQTYTLFALLFIFSIFTGIAYADKKYPEVEVLYLAPDQEPAKATLEDVEWLQGLWVGAIEGIGYQEYFVSEKNGGQMGGYVRGWFNDGTPWFYEITLFVEKNGSLEQQLRNFGADFKAWEKDDQFIRRPLIKKTENALYFEGITFVKKSRDEHIVYLNVPNQDNAKNIVVVEQTRKKLL